MNRDEAQRIAAAVNRIRPDWRADSIETFLGKNFADRPYRDVLIAITVIASDPYTRTPDLLKSHGPWWIAAQVAMRQPEPDGVTPRDRCPYHPAQPRTAPSAPVLAAGHTTHSHRRNPSSTQEGIRMTFTARYAGKCADCGELFPPAPRCNATTSPARTPTRCASRPSSRGARCAPAYWLERSTMCTACTATGVRVRPATAVRPNAKPRRRSCDD